MDGFFFAVHGALAFLNSSCGHLCRNLFFFFWDKKQRCFLSKFSWSKKKKYLAVCTPNALCTKQVRFMRPDWSVEMQPVHLISVSIHGIYAGNCPPSPFSLARCFSASAGNRCHLWARLSLHLHIVSVHTSMFSPNSMPQLSHFYHAGTPSICNKA